MNSRKQDWTRKIGVGLALFALLYFGAIIVFIIVY